MGRPCDSRFIDKIIKWVFFRFTESTDVSYAYDIISKHAGKIIKEEKAQA